MNRPAPSDQKPTWAHRTLTLGQTLPVQLQYEGHDENGVEVWRVPARAWHEGDHIEIGPLPPNTRIEFWVRPPNDATSGAHQ